MVWSRTLALICAALALSGAGPALSAQLVDAPPDTSVVIVDPGDVVSLGRSAQARFERARHNYLPITLSYGSSGDCDEHVGRFCTWYGEGEWYPTPEREEVVALRTTLVAELDSLQALAPGSEWLLGQRVWYRAEGGDWGGALHAARACGEAARWWCRALQGFALHGLGRYEDAQRAFSEALSLMDPEDAAEWIEPRRAVEGGVRDRFDDAEDVSADSLRAVIDRVWELADPLYLAPGNDRRTAHYARWTVTRIRERARNPFRIRWGRDLETLTVRHGWELGWERSPGLRFASLDQVIGHKHPEGRDYMPPASALDEPEAIAERDLQADRRRPRSLYAPAYAPVLLPMEGQLAVFPRGETTVFVSTHFLPDDTTFHSDHEHDLPWLEPGDQRGMPDRIGLFALPAAEGTLHRRVTRGSADGALLLTVPAGAYVVSAESWSPSRRRAGRLRRGVPARPAPADVASLSDLLLLRPLPTEPTSLEEVLDAALPSRVIRPGQSFAIAWEVAGLGFRPEGLMFEVSVTRAGRSVFSRIGQFLRLSEPPEPLRLLWDEPGPDEPRHHFRYLEMELPELEPGRYEIRMVLRTAGRSDAVATTPFEVRERS